MSKRFVVDLPINAFTPFQVPDFEFPVATIELHSIKAGKPIEFELEIGWGKPPAADLGELEIVLRKHSAVGEEIFRSFEMCHQKAVSLLEHSETGTQAEETYVLLVRAPDSKAYIAGPIRLLAIVY
ncbi:hypothetical protein K0T92_06410 [Paenibacillus oenotherae]|uniref:Uncharacterized protein n=1 Tax=Paenibacillus oenotherae TaxID=1435645 RepID=A0ABS7D3I2_9BACL|nr:hypothetical protein [Paenibacillus oenotherae]MBW7474371.1 hypothetical protein [Paenibacillus oenotherae]